MQPDTPVPFKICDFPREISYSELRCPARLVANNQRRRIEMAETTKKAKAPAKPRATTGEAKKTKKKTVAEQVTAFTPSHEEIAMLARQYWAERGHQDGQAEQDWLRAERELMKMAS
jgi:hypothetical protein